MNRLQSLRAWIASALNGGVDASILRAENDRAFIAIGRARRYQLVDKRRVNRGPLDPAFVAQMQELVAAHDALVGGANDNA